MMQIGWSRRGTTGMLAAAGVLALHVASVRADSHAVVSTDKGPVRGAISADGRQFLGIPYASPPVGSRRFKPPADVNRWHGVRDATQFAPHCAQPATPFGLSTESEDCLYLNVYTPVDVHDCDRDGDSDEHGGHGDGHGRGHDDDHGRGNHHGFPVMVWIHPGAFQYGESDDYNPRDLVSRGVIVVTINYRLGALGFMSHPALTAESNIQSSGNYGFMDQQAALRWVQRNIRHFGGDADNVTLFGESAGGLSVHTHLASPGSAGLFQRAIVQSGSYNLANPSLASAETEGTAFAAAVGCGSQTAACLRSVPVSALLAQQALNPNPSAYQPRVDGSVLPMQLGAAFASGQFNRVPVIEGTTHDEFRLFVAILFTFRGIPVTAASYPSLVASVLGVPLSTAQFIATVFYPLAAYPSPEVALAAIGTDAAFSCNARVAARSLAQYVPTWTYEFSDSDAPQIFLPPAGYPYGAFHESEVQYLFEQRVSFPAPALNSDQLQLSDAMQNYWTQFAYAGDPNDGVAPNWAPYNLPSSDNYLRFVGTTPQSFTGTAFATDHKCAVWGSP